MPSPNAQARRSFQETITAAVTDIVDHGFDSAERLAMWLERIGQAAQASLVPERVVREELDASLGAIYRRLIERGEIVKRHPGVSRYTIEKLTPIMRAELQRRIMASANLIKLNREKAVQDTLRRFSGWASSVPAGGTKAADKPEVKATVRKALASLPFEERRVTIDQGHKFAAALNETVATNSGALALTWRSHYREAGYDYREDHKERDGRVYALRGNWALVKGYMKVGPDGWYDDVTAVGEEPFCRCWAVYLYALRDLPKDMLTRSGEAALKNVRLVA